MNTMTETSPGDLRARMVDRIAAAGYLHSGPVENAMRTVPRHLFLPAVTPEQAYADDSVTTKPGVAGGRPLSCASKPTVVAMMLEQLEVHPGDRILEIGAGTGYNAALLAELAGPNGEVITIDIDPDVTAQTRRALQATGYDGVQVITGDGALGVAENAPYNRIIVTVGPSDLPPAWQQQLVPGGRLVVPLRWRGQARSVAFTHQDGHLQAEDSRLCGFIPMIGQDAEHTGHIDPEGHVTLYWDSDQAIEATTLHGVLTQSPTTTWSGVRIGANQPFDGVWLRLTGTETGTCRIAAAAPAVQAGLCTPAIPLRSPALVEEASLAYFTLRRLEDPAQHLWELGAIGHGPLGPQLAERLCEQIRAWDDDRSTQPAITAYPAGTPEEKLPSRPVINKRHIRLVVNY
jgi:protein-L-isoaspartate(D-aspartate) O-methyltransferase